MLPLYLILHNIRSAYNVGSIFRTADAAGVAKIYLCGITPTPAQKTALGAEATVPWEHVAQTWRLLEKLKKEKMHIYALEQHTASKNLFKFKPKFLPAGRQVQCALILGHERKGVSKTILKYTDAVLEIPMHGKKESLNVAVATGIAVYYLHVTRNSTQ